jgi:hypothetical protein
MSFSCCGKPRGLRAYGADGADRVGFHGVKGLQEAISDVAFGIGMGIAPLPGGLSKQCDIKQISFVSIDKRCLGLGECRRQECFFDGVGVDAVVDLGEGALEAPIEL